MTFKDLPGNIKVRLFTSFYTRIVYVSVMPFMALFFSDRLGKVFAGTFLLVTTLASFIFRLWGGYIADRTRRKTVLVASNIAGSVLMVLMTICLLPSNDFIYVFAALYLIWSIVSSMGGPAMNALILDSTDTENRKRVYVISYWLDNISVSVGIALGGLMYKNHRLELFAMLSLALTITSLIFIFFLKDNQVNLLERTHINPFRDILSNYATAVRDKKYLKYVIGLIFFFSAEFAVSNYIGIRLKETFHPVSFLGLQIDGVRMMSAITIENTLVVISLTFLISSLVERVPKPKAYILGIMFYGLGYAALNVVNTWYGVLLFGLFAVLGELICVPIHMTEQARLIPDDKRASYIAFGSLSFSGGDMLGRLGIVLGAYLIAPMMAIYTGCVVALGAFLVSASFFREEQKNVKDIDAGYDV
ncbi:MAG TPA: MFS transporter [Clostridia bacterium]|nr:MFS transporter [Clostridia bacterium]